MTVDVNVARFGLKGLFKKSAKTVLLGTAMLAVAYCGGVTNTDKRIKGVARLLSGPPVASASYNPYNLDVVGEVRGDALYAYLRDFQSGQRVLVDDQMRTMMPIDEIMGLPHVEEVIEARAQERAKFYASELCPSVEASVPPEPPEESTLGKILDELF